MILFAALLVVLSAEAQGLRLKDFYVASPCVAIGSVKAVSDLAAKRSGLPSELPVPAEYTITILTHGWFGAASCVVPKSEEEIIVPVKTDLRSPQTNDSAVLFLVKDALGWRESIPGRSFYYFGFIDHAPMMYIGPGGEFFSELSKDPASASEYVSLLDLTCLWPNQSNPRIKSRAQCEHLSDLLEEARLKAQSLNREIARPQ